MAHSPGAAPGRAAAPRRNARRLSPRQRPQTANAASLTTQRSVRRPTSNLCSSGTASPVSGSGPWTWICHATGGGTAVDCGANLAVSSSSGSSGSSSGSGSTSSSGSSSGSTSSSSGSSSGTCLSSGSAGGSSGSSSGAPPPQAAAVGYNTLTFGSNVTVTTTYDANGVPLLGSAANGANWAPFTFFGAEPMAIGFTQNGDGSVTLDGTGQGGYGAGLSTAVVGTTTPATATNITGMAFGGGAYFEAVMKADAGWTGMAFWSNDIEHMNGGSQGLYTASWPQQSSPNYPEYGDWIEGDFAEFDDPNRYGWSVHNWYGITPNDYGDVAPNWGGPIGTYDLSTGLWSPPPGSITHSITSTAFSGCRPRQPRRDMVRFILMTPRSGIP